MRRRASANVHQTSAAQMTIRTRIRTLTAVFSASLLIPKTATVSMGSRERVAGATTGTAARRRIRARRRRARPARRRPRRSASAAAGRARARSQSGPLARARFAQQIGDEADGACPHDGAVGAGEGPRALDRAVGIGLDLSGAAELAGQCL